jgi:hypothetical protein
MTPQSEWIDPFVFGDAMTRHWKKNLNNEPNEALIQTWRWIAYYIQRHLLDHDIPEKRANWHILPAPTGAGKTESVILYAAMLSNRSQADHPGALIVTQRIADCERIARRINKIGYQLYGADSVRHAIAYHSNSKTKLSELKEWAVVVITHEAYKRAVESFSYGESVKSKLGDFLEWNRESLTDWERQSRFPERKLRIIDECLDIMNPFIIGLDSLNETLAAVPYRIRDYEKYKKEVEALEAMIKILEKIDKRAKESEPVSWVLLKESRTSFEDTPSFNSLIKYLKDHRKDDQHIHEKRLLALEEIYKSWSYYYNDMGNHTINSAKLLVPYETRGCLVLDGTAGVNVAYELHEKSEVKKAPEGSRNYSNVTIHVSEGHRVGKNAMIKNGKELMPALINSLASRLKGKKVFGVCHKDVEHFMQGAEIPDFELSCGHWGAIDGANDWKDYEAAVIAGLPYLPDQWSANVFMTLQTVKDTDWLRSAGNRPWGKYPDIQQALKRGRMSSDIVQAVNRIRCRRVIDRRGNCPPAEIYILLPSNRTEAQSILEDIKGLMPGVKIEAWAFKYQKRKTKRSNKEQVLLAYLKTMNHGDRETKDDIMNKTAISPRTMARILGKVKKAGTHLNETFKKLGLKLETIREGRAFKTYLIKI